MKFVSADDHPWPCDEVPESSSLPHARDYDFIVSLRRHGFPVLPVGNGPFQAIRDGCVLLAPFGFCVRPASFRTQRSGRYLLAGRRQCAPVVITFSGQAWNIFPGSAPVEVDLPAMERVPHTSLFWLASLEMVSLLAPGDE